MTEQILQLQSERRVPFRVPLSPAQVVEICQRRNQRKDSRTLADWVEDGLRLALNSGSASGVRTDATHDYEREIELFCVLTTAAPTALSGRWRRLYEAIRHEETFWALPKNRWSDDEKSDALFEPYLDRAALSQKWVELLCTTALLIDKSCACDVKAGRHA